VKCYVCHSERSEESLIINELENGDSSADASDLMLEMVNHILKKEKGKSHGFGYSGCTTKHHLPKGGLPWIMLRVANLIAPVNLFTSVWMFTRKAGV
jgi:hypothetical protein